MERNDQIYSTSAGTMGGFGSGGRPSAAADSVDTYVKKNLNAQELAEDIQKLVTERMHNSIPDEKRLMMDLIAQVGELTGEVKELRRQLDTKPYAVFTCPSGQMKDITLELAEIKSLLRQEPGPQELSVPDTEPIALGRELHGGAGQPDAAPPADSGGEAVWPDADGYAASPQEPDAPAEPETAFAVQQPESEDKPSKKQKTRKKATAVSVLGNILFYLVLIGVVVGAFLAKSSGGQPTVIAGYSAFTVLSSSMEDTYPKGSLIITHSVDPSTLEVGDDITYMVSTTSSITHRIIGITENYLDTGARAFETQGTMNEKPDKEPVAAANVVGEVVFCSALLGQAASFIKANWPLLIFFVLVLCGLLVFLKWNLRREEKPAKKGKKRRKKGASAGKA